MSWVSTNLLSIDRAAEGTVTNVSYTGKYAVQVSSPNDTQYTVSNMPGIPPLGSQLAARQPSDLHQNPAEPLESIADPLVYRRHLGAATTR